MSPAAPGPAPAHAAATTYLLIVASVATFLMTGAGMMRSPFLLDMARDLRVHFAAIASLFSWTAIAWGLVSLGAGAASDRFGRRGLLLASVAALAATSAGIALAESYAAVAVWTIIGGAAGGVWMSVIYAEVAARVPSDRRGRALGTIITGQSVALALGVPLAAGLGALAGWRGVTGLVAGASALVAVALAFVLKGNSPRPAASAPGSPKPLWRSTFTPQILVLLFAGITDRVCFALLAIYIPTFLATTYHVSLADLVLPLAVSASGNFAGNLFGARLADRMRKRLRVFVFAALASAVAALVLFYVTPGLGISAVLGFLFSGLNAMGRPALLASLGDVPEKTRGSVMGMNVASASIGWLGAAMAGAWIIGEFGFPALGTFAAATAAIGGIAVLASGHGTAPRPAG